MFEKYDRVKLIIGKSSFDRTVLEVRGWAVYLVEGGDLFDNRTGKVFGEGSKMIRNTGK